MGPAPAVPALAAHFPSAGASRYTRALMPSTPRVLRALCLVSGLAGTLVSWAPSALAQTEVELAAARQWFKEGEAAEKAGDCATAIARFQKALGVKSTPQIELRVGACQEKLGLFASAEASYAHALDKARELSLKKVVGVAEEQLAAVKPRVPHLTLAADGAYEGLRVTVDGEPLAGALGASMALDPGPHALVAEAPGRRPLELTVDLAAGETKRLTLTLEPIAAPESTRAERAPEADGSGPLPYVLLGVGGAAVVGGAVLFVVARGQDGDIDDRCGGAERLACPASQRDAIESDVASVDQLQGLALGLGGLGVAAAVVGGVLLASEPASETGRAPAPRVAFSPWPGGGGGVFLSGGF